MCISATPPGKGPASCAGIDEREASDTTRAVASRRGVILMAAFLKKEVCRLFHDNEENQQTNGLSWIVLA
jgi:hypothetical protein